MVTLFGASLRCHTKNASARTYSLPSKVSEQNVRVHAPVRVQSAHIHWLHLVTGTEAQSGHGRDRINARHRGTQLHMHAHTVVSPGVPGCRQYGGPPLAHAQHQSAHTSASQVTLPTFINSCQRKMSGLPFMAEFSGETSFSLYLRLITRIHTVYELLPGCTGYRIKRLCSYNIWILNLFLCCF